MRGGRGVHLVYGRYGQFRFDQDDVVVIVDGVQRTACRFCKQPVTAPRFKFYCGQTCRTRYWREVVPGDWPTIRGQALKRDGRRCVLCGATEHLEVDHVKPVAMYPELELQLANTRTLCRPCHARHGWRPAGQVLVKDLPATQTRLLELHATAGGTGGPAGADAAGLLPLTPQGGHGAAEQP